MKNNYMRPIIEVSELEKIDVLLISVQTDNRHVDSTDVIDRDAITDSAVFAQKYL